MPGLRQERFGQKSDALSMVSTRTLLEVRVPVEVRDVLHFRWNNTLFTQGEEAMKKPESFPMPLPVLSCTKAEGERLLKAGFRPVVRWVDVNGRSDVPLKTIEALTLLGRRGK